LKSAALSLPLIVSQNPSSTGSAARAGAAGVATSLRVETDHEIFRRRRRLPRNLLIACRLRDRCPNPPEDFLEGQSLDFAALISSVTNRFALRSPNDLSGTTG